MRLAPPTFSLVQGCGPIGRNTAVLQCNIADLKSDEVEALFFAAISSLESENLVEAAEASFSNAHKCCLLAVVFVPAVAWNEDLQSQAFEVLAHVVKVTRGYWEVFDK